MCGREFLTGEMVARVRCRYIFHEACCFRHVQSQGVEVNVIHPNPMTYCPSCHGFGKLQCIFRFIHSSDNKHKEMYSFSPPDPSAIAAQQSAIVAQQQTFLQFIGDRITSALRGRSRSRPGARRIQDVPMPDAAQEQLISPASRAVSVERYPTYAGSGSFGPQVRSPLQAPYPSSDGLQHHVNAFTGIVFTDDVQAETLHTYHANVKLDGRSSLVLDIGSIRNLAGERWI